MMQDPRELHPASGCGCAWLRRPVAEPFRALSEPATAASGEVVIWVAEGREYYNAAGGSPRTSPPRSSRPSGSKLRCRSSTDPRRRSQEHTSELQSRQYLVSSLLLETT